MEGRRSFVSSRFFANDPRPVPNIVALYERPRHKIRRDATHVFGGMFGWNNPEETERALRAESSRAEEATATPDSATPVDAALAGPSQRCIKKPAKRAKRRGFAPLIDMGASILSLHFQELLRRQHQHEEEDLTPISAPAKRPTEPTADIPTPSTVTASASKGTRISVSAGDAPMAKKLRLTISTAPPNDVPLSMTLPSSFPQMPPSPPDTSSNASKAPAEEPALGLASASTPMDALPLLPDFDATLPFDHLDSDSSSSSSSESSSDLDSDSPDLSSSSSTRSIVQDKGKGKANATQRAASTQKRTKSASPSPIPVARGPSTPPRKKRPTHKPGWIGWVQTEESPDHSRLIRLDDAPVILGRRTRSGREFHDPPPPPPSRRRSTNGGQPKPDEPPRMRLKPTRRGRKSEAPTGEKSKQQSAWQEAQKRVASGESGDAPRAQEGDVGDDEPKEQATENFAKGESAPEHADGEPPVVSPSEHPSRPVSTSVPVPPVPISASSQEVNTSSPRKKSQISSASSVPPASGTSPVVPLTPVLKLTRSDAVITPTAGRQDDLDEKEHNKKDTPTNQKKSGASMKTVSTKSLANAADERDSPSQASPSCSKVTADVSAPSKKPLATTRNDHPKNMYIALKKSRPNTSGSTSRPPVTSKVGSSQRRSGWGSDTSAEETSSAAVTVPRIASPSPPEKARRPAPINPTPNTSSGSSALAAASTKPGDAPMPAPSTKPSASSTDRQLYFSRYGKSIHVGNGASVSALGKRKEPVAQASSAHFKKRKLSRKLVLSSSDESDGARPPPQIFVPHPFERRAKQMELTRKGVSGDAFRHEMEKWLEMKRAEWKSKEKAKGRDSEKSGSDGKATGNAHRPSKPVELGSGAAIDNTTSKSSKETHKGSKETITVSRGINIVGDLPRIPRKDSSQSDHAGNSPKIQKASSKRVWNGDWGMDVHQVSVTVSGDAKNKFKKF
ncbi:hypothetical protein FRC06_001427, partial [Ceratobasidium sp. 370]